MFRHARRAGCALLLLALPTTSLRAASPPAGAGPALRVEDLRARTPRDAARRLRFLRLFAASAMSEARSRATRFLARRYPGQPVEHRRTFQRAGGSPDVWFSLFDVGVRPAQEVEVRVDLETGEVGEV